MISLVQLYNEIKVNDPNSVVRFDKYGSFYEIILRDENHLKRIIPFLKAKGYDVSTCSRILTLFLQFQIKTNLHAFEIYFAIYFVCFLFSISKIL